MPTVPMPPETPLVAARSSRGTTVRHLATHEEYEACVRIQRQIWGERYTDWVPASLLRVAQHVGGIVAGAFDDDGGMIGFVFSLTGLRGGRVVHWSHMLAVLPPYRNQGVARRLKDYQRHALRGTGVEAIYWTFDPLFARNAHFNLNGLGVRVCEYVLDMYGDTRSELHAFGTDRLLVRWPVVSNGAGAVRDCTAAADAPVVNDVLPEEDATTLPPVVRIVVPADIEALAAESLAAARDWRAGTRRAFTRWFGAGYRVAGFDRADGDTCFYALTRAAEADSQAC